MERAVVKQYNLELLRAFFGELIEKYLKGGTVAKRHLHFKMLPGYGRECPEQVAGFKNLLKGTQRLDTFQSKPLAISGE
jgi:hypothetical protein